MSKTRMMLIAAVSLMLGLVAAARSNDARATSSSCTPVMGSEVCTWVVTERGSATELGATIPMALIESVPIDVEMVWPPRELASVPLPAEAREALGIDHMGLNWEAHGHPPASFMTPHFDFHFYNITSAAVDAIDCVDDAKPATLPRGYALPDIDVPGMGTFIGLCVPKMGMHAMPGHEVDDTDAFQASMMLGYYGGQPIFVEPMVSRALLLSKSDFTLPVPAVVNLPAGVRYPHGFRAEYDTHADAYRLIFTGFNAE
jgi:hypothetical protein